MNPNRETPPDLPPPPPPPPEEKNDLYDYFEVLQKMSNAETCPPLFAPVIASEEAFDHLEKLYRLMEQMLNLREQNAKLLRRVRDLEHLRNIQSLNQQVNAAFGVNADFERDTAFAESILETILSESKCDNSRLGARRSILRKKVSRMSSVDARNLSLDEELLDENNRRRDRSKPCKVSKWTKVKAAFKWEKTTPNIDLSNRYLQVPSSTPNTSSAEGFSSNSSMEDLNNFDRRNANIEENHTLDDRSIQEFKGEKSSRKPWNKVKDIIQPRSSLKNKPTGCEDVNISINCIPPAVVTRYRQIVAEDVDNKQPSKWTRVKNAFFSPVAYKYDDEYNSIFKEGLSALKESRETDNQQLEIQKTYEQLQKKLSLEFQNKLREWEKIKYSAPEVKEAESGRKILSKQNLPPEFQKKLEDWQKIKDASRAGPSKNRRELFHKNFSCDDSNNNYKLSENEKKRDKNSLLRVHSTDNFVNFEKKLSQRSLCDQKQCSRSENNIEKIGEGYVIQLSIESLNREDVDDRPEPEAVIVEVEDVIEETATPIDEYLSNQKDFVVYRSLEPKARHQKVQRTCSVRIQNLHINLEKCTKLVQTLMENEEKIYALEPQLIRDKNETDGNALPTVQAGEIQLKHLYDHQHLINVSLIEHLMTVQAANTNQDISREVLDDILFELTQLVEKMNTDLIDRKEKITDSKMMFPDIYKHIITVQSKIFELKRVLSYMFAVTDMTIPTRKIHKRRVDSDSCNNQSEPSWNNFKTQRDSYLINTTSLENVVVPTKANYLNISSSSTESEEVLVSSTPVLVETTATRFSPELKKLPGKISREISPNILVMRDRYYQKVTELAEPHNSSLFSIVCNSPTTDKRVIIQKQMYEEELKRSLEKSPSGFLTRRKLSQSSDSSTEEMKVTELRRIGSKSTQDEVSETSFSDRTEATSCDSKFLLPKFGSGMNRLSQVSNESDSSYNSSAYDGILLKSASAGMINVDVDTYSKILPKLQEDYSLSLPRTKRSQEVPGKKSLFSKLVSKFRKVKMKRSKTLNTISALCRQSLVVDVDQQKPAYGRSTSEESPTSQRK